MAVCALLLAATSHGEEFFISPEGDNANPGTQQAPFRTLETARDAARSLGTSEQQHTLILLPGTYPRS